MFGWRRTAGERSRERRKPEAGTRTCRRRPSRCDACKNHDCAALPLPPLRSPGARTSQKNRCTCSNDLNTICKWHTDHLTAMTRCAITPTVDILRFERSNDSDPRHGHPRLHVDPPDPWGRASVHAGGKAAEPMRACTGWGVREMGGAPRNPAPRNHFWVRIVKPSGCHCTDGHLTSRVFTEDQQIS